MDWLIIFCAKYLFLAVVLIYLLALWQASNKHKKQLLVAVVLAGILAIFLAKISGKLYYDPRPFVSQQIKPLVEHSTDNGFPSEHTLFAMTISAVLIYYRRRLGLLAAVLAIVVGIGRVAAGVHSPIDILGGAVIGAIAGSAGYWLTKKIINRA